MTITKRHNTVDPSPLWETEMDVDILISNPLLLKIEPHAVVMAFLPQRSHHYHCITEAVRKTNICVSPTVSTPLYVTVLLCVSTN